MEAPQSEAELPYNPANTLVGIYLRETKTNSKRYIPTCSIKNDRIISVRFQGKPFNITVIQIYVPTTDAKEAEVDQFNEDPQDLLELIPKKDVLFIIRDWNGKAESQEIPGVTGKFGLGIQNEAGQRLTILPRECIGPSKHRFSTTQETTSHMDITKWSIPNQIDYILCSQRWEKLYTVSKNKTWS